LDNRIGEVVYRPNDVTKIWSTPAGVILIQFGEGEIFDAATGADACPPHYKPEDNCGFSAEPRGNFLFLKLRKCLIPEPVLVLTKTASGKFRSYNFELHTEPQICSDTPIAQPDSGMKLVSSANAAPKPVGTGNLKYISEDALTEHADKPVQYSVRFQYPGDEAEKRRETSRERRERAKKEAVTQALNREVDFKTHDPFYGNRNYRYAIRGSNNLQPRGIFDNGYLTAITYPGMQRMPAVFRVDPDGKESTANFTVRGDTIIMTGTAQVIRVRDGLTVAEFYNLGYSLSGATPGTGTASPSVERIVKGASE
jgi:type IV secretion system protein VirB9